MKLIIILTYLFVLVLTYFSIMNFVELKHISKKQNMIMKELRKRRS